jgi:hypothetical protein
MYNPYTFTPLTGQPSIDRKLMPALAPTVIVFLGFATSYALLFHLWRGRRVAHLLLFWLVSLLGFGLGYLLASLWSIHPVVLGGIPVVEASLGALLLLLVASRFSV